MDCHSRKNTSVPIHLRRGCLQSRLLYTLLASLMFDVYSNRHTLGKMWSSFSALYVTSRFWFNKNLNHDFSVSELHLVQCVSHSFPPSWFGFLSGVRWRRRTESCRPSRCRPATLPSASGPVRGVAAVRPAAKSAPPPLSWWGAARRRHRPTAASTV
jgi:hypothetical protein